MDVDLLISCVIKVKTGNESGKLLVMQIGAKLKNSAPRRKKTLGWAMLSPDL